MEFRQSFVVKAPADAVWAFLTDPRRAAGALPGAAVTEVDGNTFAGTMTVKVGPVTTQYRGKARFERLDPDERTAEMVGSGQDVKGRGGAEMKMTSRLVERSPGETEVSVVSEVSVTGILAQLGRGMIQDVSDQLFQRFTAAVRAQLEVAAPAGDAPPDAPHAPLAGASSPAAVSAAAPAGGKPVPSVPPPTSPSEPLDGLAFGAEVAGRVARRWTRSPGFWVGLAAVVALVFWMLL